MITSLLLAAGASRRFGSGGSKLVQDLHGVPLIRWSAAALTDPCIGEHMVVIAPGQDAIRHALSGMDLRFVVNLDAERGIGTSIARGVASVAPATTAIVVALADEPFLDRDVVRAVLDRYQATSAAIVAPRFAGVIGHPVLFSQATFAELAALDGDRGARGVIGQDAGRVQYLDFGAAAAPDVDTADDLALARARAQNMSPFTPPESC